MIEFSNNSLKKIIFISDSQDDFDFGLNNVIKLGISEDDINTFNDLLIKYRYSIDGIITYSAGGWGKIDKFFNITKLPDYYARRWYHFLPGDDAQDILNNYIKQIEYNNISGFVNPKYSIITPLYKTKEKYFKECYDTLVHQNNNDWEWVLVDDSPEPIDYLDKYIKNDIRVIYIKYNNQTNGNIGLSKFRAFNDSCGKYLIELDHDDKFFPWTLEILDEAIENNSDEYGFIYSDDCFINEKKQIYNMFGTEYAFGYCRSYKINGIKNPNIEICANDNSPINSVTIRHIVGVPNHLRCWRRDIYFEILGHNKYERIADDYELIIRTFLKTKFIHIKYPCYIQRYEGQNSQYNDDNIKDIQERVKNIGDYYNKDIRNRIFELTGFEENIFDTAREVIESYFNTEINLPNCELDYFPNGYKRCIVKYAKRTKEIKPPYYI